MKHCLLLLFILTIDRPSDLIQAKESETVDEGKYVSSDKPGEYIEIKGSKIYFQITLIGWQKERVQFVHEEYNFKLKADGKLFVYRLRSANPLLLYDWRWDFKKKQILQNEELVDDNYKTYRSVTIRVFSKQKP